MPLRKMLSIDSVSHADYRIMWCLQPRHLNYKSLSNVAKQGMPNIDYLEQDKLT